MLVRGSFWLRAAPGPSIAAPRGSGGSFLRRSAGCYHCSPRSPICSPLGGSLATMGGNERFTGLSALRLGLFSLRSAEGGVRLDGGGGGMQDATASTLMLSGAEAAAERSRLLGEAWREEAGCDLSL